MDKTRLNTLLDSVYELEGLIHLALNRDDIPDTLEMLIARKGRMVADATIFATDVAVDPVKLPEEPAIEEPEVLAPLGITPEVIEAAEESEKSEESEESERSEESEKSEISEESEESEGSEKSEESDIPNSDSYENSEPSEPEMEAAPEVVSLLATEINPVPTPSVPKGRLVFTINDRFRFKRELFANSDEAFNSALSNVATLDSYEEAEDYFLNDLQWNPEREEVKDFLEVIRKYYK